MLKSRRLLAFAVLLGLSALPARAQLDPRLQVTKTDFLDLYQQTNSSTLKPEIVTVFDFSGSTQALMYHSQFPNIDKFDTDNPNGGTQLYITVTRSGSSGSYVYSVSGSLSADKYDSANASSGLGALTLTFVGLVRPNGNLVTLADVQATSTSLPGGSSSPRESDARNWIRCASHARFKATIGTDTRTIDIPMPWKIMDATCTGSPLSSKMATDPFTGTTYEMDTNYRNTATSVISGGGVATGSTSSTRSRSGLAIVGYAPNYIGWLFAGKSGGKYVVPDAVNASLSPDNQVHTAFSNGIPSETRNQAVKEAAIRTWLDYQNKVYWAFRFLNPGGENGKGTSVYTDSRHTVDTSNVISNKVTGDDRGWVLLNSDSAGGIGKIAGLFASGNTPLTYAVANAYAQYNDPNSIFNDFETGTNKPLDCMKHFLIVFTDGQPTSDGSPTDTTPYLDSTGITGKATDGNATIASNTGNLNQGSSYWNIFTLAGVAAHGGDPNLASVVRDPASVSYPSGTYSSSSNSTPSALAPFWIQGRGAGLDKVNGTGKFSQPHPIQTMTVGLSLGGSYTDSASGKARLFRAAVFGDPAQSTWDLSVETPFTFSTPGDPTSPKTTNSAYFFDASDPQTLVDGLGAAFKAAVSLSGTNTAAAPTTPPVGLNLGNQIYLGTFTPPDKGGPVWSGDLMMFPTYTAGDVTQIIDTAGNPIANPDVNSAQWAASKVFISGGTDVKKWSARTIWTRIPGSATAPNPGLVRFEDQTQDSTAYSVIKPYVGSAALTDAQRNALIDFVQGGDTSKTAPYPNRSTIMGDIVNSAPATIEYNLADLSSWGGSLPGTLSSAASNAGARFRVVFVGDNQGYMHAFGEVSWPVQIQILDPNSTATPQGKLNINVTHAVADELWAFIPTDFLANFAYLQDSSNSHRFMVDGTPYTYVLDAPAAGAISGNGKVDAGERALLLFGLRKGGRSYYALDVSNPFRPKLGPNDAAGPAGGWALRPDEASLIPAGSATASAPLTTIQKVVANMGFSTSQPFVGRVLYDGGAAAQTIRDAVFLGGGFSTQDVDAQFLTAGKATPLGRSALALDINTGQYLMAWDLTTTSFWRPTQPWLIGPVASGVVPFSFDLNSGLVARAYFNDYGGNMWAVGSMAPDTVDAGFTSFRVDTNVIDHWTKGGGAAVGDPAAIRLVYSQQGIKSAPTGTTINNDGDFSTLPAPFLLGNSPILRTSSPKVSPLTVGIALNTGDRNNPLDRSYDSTNLKPTANKLIVVFDRQDSADSSVGKDTTGILPSDLLDLSSASSSDVTEGSSSFYLNSGKYGYYTTYPATGSAFVNKGIYDPVVLANTLFFSYFNPTASDPCTGGQGNTISSRICDAVHPPAGFSFTDAPNNAPQCSNGVVGNWIGVATNFSPQNTYTVSQGGTVLTPGGSQKTGLALQSFTGNPSQRLPRARTWRVVR